MELSENERKNEPGRFAEYGLEFLKIFLIAAAVILPIRLFLIQPFYVKGSSMEPNFFENEYLIVDKLTPAFQEYKRGEVIVFRHPPTEKYYLIKRIIAVPGERVVIQNRQITIYNAEYPEGVVLDEQEYTPRPLRPQAIDETLGPDEYYVLGDNRPVSMDSEYFGPVDESQIVGRVVIRGFPLSRISVIPIPEY